MESLKTKISLILHDNKNLRFKIEENLNSAIELVQDETLNGVYSFDVFVLKFILWYENCKDECVINYNEIMNRYFAKSRFFYFINQSNYNDTYSLTNYFEELHYCINSLLNDNISEEYQTYCTEKINKFLNDKSFLDMFHFIYENNIKTIKYDF